MVSKLVYTYLNVEMLKKLKKVEKIGYHSNSNFECNTGRGSIEVLSIALGSHQKADQCTQWTVNDVTYRKRLLK